MSKSKRADQKGTKEIRGAQASATLLTALEPQLVWVPVKQLTGYKGNARTHSRKQVRQIAASIAEFGFNNPILADDHGEIIAGHGRLTAAKELGMETVPVVRVSHLSSTQKRAFVLADNKLAEKGGWDQEILTGELEALADLDFDMELTGFNLAEIDIILDEADEPKREASGPEDDVPEASLGQAVTCEGDLWLIGKHRLFCGDPRNNESYELLLDGDVGEFTFTDPFLGAAISGSGARPHKHAKHFGLPTTIGGEDESALVDYLAEVFKHLVAHSADGALHDVCTDWQHLSPLMAAGTTAFSEHKDLCVWVKDVTETRALYPNQHEFVAVWKSGGGAHINNRRMDGHGHIRSNVWNYTGVPVRRSDQECIVTGAMKPVVLVADAIKDCSHRNGIVLDPFAGWGTTLIASERAGRRVCAIEMLPSNVDIAIRRWQSLTGKPAVLAATGQHFDDIAEEDSAPPALAGDQGSGSVAKGAF